MLRATCLPGSPEAPHPGPGPAHPPGQIACTGFGVRIRRRAVPQPRRVLPAAQVRVEIAVPCLPMPLASCFSMATPGGLGCLAQLCRPNPGHKVVPRTSPRPAPQETPAQAAVHGTHPGGLSAHSPGSPMETDRGVWWTLATHARCPAGPWARASVGGDPGPSAPRGLGRLLHLLRPCALSLLRGEGGCPRLGTRGPDTCLPRPWHMIPWSTPRMPNGSLGRWALGSALRGTAGTRLVSWGWGSLASSWASPGARNKGRVWCGDLGGRVFSLTLSPAPGPLSVPFPSSGSLPTHPNSPYLRVAPCHTSALGLQVTSTDGPSLIDRPLHDALCPLVSF